MLRFSASEEEIASLLRFLGRRSPGGLWMVPLEADHRDELRFRRTARPFLRLLRHGDDPLQWGLLPLPERDGAESPDAPASAPTPTRLSVRHLRAASPGIVGGVPTPKDAAAPADARLRVDPDENGLILIALGEPRGPERRRDGVLATRDPLRPRRVSNNEDDPAAATAAATDEPPPPPAPVGAPTELRSELVEKCARRLRRRAERGEGGRWEVP